MHHFEHLRITVIVSAVLALGGCSAVIDSSKYVGGALRDAGNVDSGAPADGSRGDAMVDPDSELPNRPPVLTTVALSTYLPAVGEPIFALPGPVIDPDGDPTLIRYEWRRGETVIESALGANLDTSSLTAGDEIRLEAWANDGMIDGPRVVVGPVVLAADVMRWRPLSPNGFGTLLDGVVYDAPRRRYVRIDRDLLWEYWVDTAGELRIAPIAPSGGAPSVDNDQVLVIHDVAGERLVVLTSASTSTGYALDLSRRGGERWSPITLGGTAPGLRVGAAVWYDTAARRAWLYGGFQLSPSPSISNQLWSLDLTPGSERWAQTPLGGAPPSLFGATMTADPITEGALILVGGASPTGTDIAIRSDIYRITIDGSSATMVQLPGALPAPAFGSVSVTDEERERIVIVGGATDIDSPTMQFGVAIYDPATGTFVRPSSPATGQGVLGIAHFDPDDGSRILAFRGFANGVILDDGFDLRAVDVETGDVTPVVNEPRAPALSEAGMSFDGVRALLVGGRFDDLSANPVVYSLDVASGAWTTITPLGDAVSGASPTPRYGNRFFDSSPWTGIQLWNGRLDSSATADGEVWELVAGARWLHRTLRMGVPPPARVGAAFVAGGACGADQNYVVGGEAPDGTLLGDAMTLVCDLGDRLRECYWEVSAAGGTPPAPRSWATLGVDHAPTVWMFGGRTVFGGSAEVFSFDACAGGAAAWTRVPAMGTTTPSPRYGHSMLLDRPESGGLDSFLVFGGTGDGTIATTSNETWRLEILSTGAARWVPVEPEGMLWPRPRAFHQAIWDDGGSRMIVHGGRDPDTTLGDSWELVIRP
jgi:hypothetical protein